MAAPTISSVTLTGDGTLEIVWSDSTHTFSQVGVPIIGANGKLLALDGSGNIGIGSSALPAGAATEATLAAAKADLDTLARVGTTSIVTFTCGTVAYAASDAVGVGGGNAALQFATIGAAGEWLLTSAALEIDTTALISGETSYRLYLYNVTPPSALADSAAWTLPSGDRASFLGVVPLGTPVALAASTLYVEVNGVNKQITLAGASLFAYLVSDGAYTPTARVFKLTLHGVPV